MKRTGGRTFQRRAKGDPILGLLAHVYPATRAGLAAYPEEPAALPISHFVVAPRVASPCSRLVARDILFLLAGISVMVEQSNSSYAAIQTSEGA